MEIAHALGLVPSGRGRAGDPSHSPVTAADAGSNRGYNVRDRSFLADDRTALYNSGTGFTNTSTLIEQLDYQFLLCALGGSSTADCANPGLIGNNVPSGPRFVMSGTVAPHGLSVRQHRCGLLLQRSRDSARQLRTLHPPSAQHSRPAARPQVLRTDFVRVSFAGTHHEDSDHAAGEHKDGVVDVAVPFNPDADRIEFRNGTTVLKTFVASAVPELTSFQVTHTGDGRYTQSAIEDASPTVSPDGGWVAWTEDPGGEDLSRIQVGPIEDSGDAVELNGINAVLDGESQYDPAWRPDGGALAFVSDGDLYTIDVDTSGATPTFSNLTFVVGYDDIDDAGLYTGHPTWSPDGAELAFDADGAIFKIAADGELGDEVQLTFTGDASHPSWSQTDGDDRIAYERQAPSDVGFAATLMRYVRPDDFGRLGVTSHGTPDVWYNHGPEGGSVSAVLVDPIRFRRGVRRDLIGWCLQEHGQRSHLDRQQCWLGSPLRLGVGSRPDRSADHLRRHKAERQPTARLDLPQLERRRDVDRDQLHVGSAASADRERHRGRSGRSDHHLRSNGWRRRLQDGE